MPAPRSSCTGSDLGSESGSGSDNGFYIKPLTEPESDPEPRPEPGWPVVVADAGLARGTRSCLMRAPKLLLPFLIVVASSWWSGLSRAPSHACRL